VSPVSVVIPLHVTLLAVSALMTTLLAGYGLSHR